MKLGTATCLLAENFAKDLDQLSREDKLFHFNRLTSLNDRVRVNGAHFALSFYPGEIIPDQQMQTIAREYMQRIGMGRQPFLVYRHNDTSNDHLHIVTTRIQPNGDPIMLDPRMLHESRRICLDIEKTHALSQKASPESIRELQKLKYAQKIAYGKTGTKLAISKVLDTILPRYKYTSLEELNAVLRLYNIRVQHVKFNPRKLHFRGLYYQVLDDQGKIISLPISSSHFETRPTLLHLEQLFAANAPEYLQKHQQWEKRITAAINWALLNKPLDLPRLQQALKAEQISAVPFRNKQGILEDIYFVDHRSGAIFQGARLGERYSAAAMRQRCPDLTAEQQQALRQEEALREQQGQQQRQSQQWKHNLH